MKFQHEIYLSEKEIGDILHEKWIHLFDDFPDRVQVLREYRICGHVPDFIELKSYGNQKIIEIFELKITANMDSVRQICRYRRVIEEHARILFTEKGGIIPTISMNLIARNIDAQIIDVCEELGVGLWRLKLKTKKDIDLVLESEPILNIPIDQGFIMKLEDFING